MSSIMLQKYILIIIASKFQIYNDGIFDEMEKRGWEYIRGYKMV